MEKLPKIFGSLKYNIIYILGIPVFCLGFVLLYKPHSVVALLEMGRDMLSFNTTIVMCILLGVMILSRVLLLCLYRQLQMTWLKYAAWEVAEIVSMSLFSALYISLMYHGDFSYFWVLGWCAFYLFFITIYPYIIFDLAIALAGKNSENIPQDDSLMRFMDSTQRLKLMIAPSAVLYIAANENYVNICYLDGERLKEYALRSSMKALEPMMQKYGMVRCQRSYYINPQHVKVLRRDKEGMINAELDTPNVKAVPVSPKYYDALAKWL